MRSWSTLAVVVLALGGCAVRPASDPRSRGAFLELEPARPAQQQQQAQATEEAERAESEVRLADVKGTQADRDKDRGTTEKASPPPALAAIDRGAARSEIGAPEAQLAPVREAFSASVRDRVAQLDTRVRSVLQRANATSAGTRAAIDEDRAIYGAQRSAILERSQQVLYVPASSWRPLTKEVDRRIDALESIVARMEGRLP